MDSKIKDGQRSVISKEMETLPKSKRKEKARKELWDSLCAVYENEADKENGEMEMEDVDVCDLEDWTVTNPDTSMRALTQLAVTNPQILSALASTFSGNADLKSELKLEDKIKINKKLINEIKKKKDAATSKSCKYKSLTYVKSTKTFSPVKKCKKPRSVSQKEKLFNGIEAKAKSQQIKDRGENESSYCVDSSVHVKYGVKSSKGVKSKHLKNTSPNENCSINSNTADAEDKKRRKLKGLERNKKLNAGKPEDFMTEKDKEDSSVIVLHKYKKGIINKHTEPTSEEVNSSSKSTNRPEKNSKKINEHKLKSQKYSLPNDRSSCNNLKKQSSTIKVEGKHSFDDKHQLKDKIRKKRDKGVVYKTLSTTLESKLRKKRKKLERQQILKEVASTVNADIDIYDKIKNLPLKIDENQLIFMHPSHLAKALENFKIKKRNHPERVSTDSTCNELNENNPNSIIKEDEKTQESNKLALNNNDSSKRLRVLSSFRKMKKSIPIVLDEKSDISLIKVSKHKKEQRKRRSKPIFGLKNKNIPEEPDLEGETRGNGKIKTESHLLSSENSSKPHWSVVRQNVCFGDNPMNVTDVQNEKQHTALSDNLSSKSKYNKEDSNFKNNPTKELKIRKINQKEMEKLKKIIKKNDDSKNQIKHPVTEDENKLSFQLLKTNMNSKNVGRLKKNVYSISDRMDSKENIVPAIQNDRLYVTKRMLFYTNKESSSTSKESLNIAIRRDTEISNNGSSNNVLNVVIKQKKNSSTSTKSINSPKLAIENQCSKHCDTKSLEKIFVENCLEKIYNKDANKSKHLKEAECQTEEKTLNSDNKEGSRKPVSTHSLEVCSNTVQDEFRNFFTYHFKNMNPAVWRNKALGNNSNKKDNEMLKKTKIFQPVGDRINVQCKFEDHHPNFFKINDKSLTLDNQYSKIKLSGFVHKFDSVSYSKNNGSPEMKPFIRVLENDEKYLHKMKCDIDSCVNKVSVPYENKNVQHESDESKGITKLKVRIDENHCQKTESENIAEKLKSIGLSDKTSFVKVITSKSKLESAVNTKVYSEDVLKYKPMKSPRIKIDILSKPVKVNVKQDLKKVAKRQKSKFFLPKNIINRTEGMEKDNLFYPLCNQEITNSGSITVKANCLLEKNNQITDSYNWNTNNFWDLQNTMINNFQNLTVGDNMKLTKENFVNVLPENEDVEKKNKVMDNTREITSNLFQLAKKPSYGTMKNFIVSEVGVQTESSVLPSVPYKNESCLNKVDNSSTDYKNEENVKETDFFQEKPDSSNVHRIGKLVNNDIVDKLPQEKGSFVHIISKDCDNDTFLSKNSILFNNNVNVIHPINYSTKNEKQIGILKGSNGEKQIIDKVNAVYYFLQYLDKMLKDNSFLKPGINIENTNTIGNFNSTLRCLCNNCVEIIKKIEVNKIENLKDRKLIENCFSKPLNGAFFQAQARNDCSPNVNSLLNGQCVNVSGFNNDSTISSDPISNNGQKNPFCVIVTPEEKPLQHNYNDFFIKIENNQNKNISEPISSFDFKERSYENFIKQKFSEMVTKKSTKCSKIPISKLNCNKITMDNNSTFYKKIHQSNIPSNNYSSKFLPLKAPLLKSCEPENTFDFTVFNSNSKKHPQDTEKPQFYYLNNDNSKLKLDSQNEYVTPGNCFAKQHDLNKDLDSYLCNSSKTILKHLKNDISKTNCCLTCFKNNIHEYSPSKNISSGKEIDELQNKSYNQSTSCKIQTEPALSGIGHCKCMRNECNCSQNVKTSNKCEWLPKIKSSFRLSFKKDGKTLMKDLPNASGLPSENIDKTKPLRKGTGPIISKNLDFGTNHKSITSAKTQLNAKSNLNSFDFTKTRESSDHCTNYKINSRVNCNEECKRELTDRKPPEDSKQKHKATSKGFSAQTPPSNLHSPRGSIIIIKRNLHRDSSTKNTSSSNSVEYLYSTQKCSNENEGNEEDKGLDSDGWVPLNDITEIENNQIYLGMDIKNMTVRHVDYVQKFPENI